MKVIKQTHIYGLWHNSIEEIPDNTRAILIMWRDGGITQGYYEDGEFHDGVYSYIPDTQVHWMEIPSLSILIR